MATTTRTRMTYSEIETEIQAMSVEQVLSTRCRHCRNTGWIVCPDHCAEGNYTTDPETGYRWCHTCDTAEERAPKTSCPCANLD
ncbi:hypothetical protein E1091_14200 [Micromonospora fluostatini]|uniref:Uncharacterized protein n=1 Tax=Micromonospora fluostatini TaxID=1629071 RepID=A0ABY2DEN4_9ACTN|nr:hypothetical protein E1091_14200 [Micromonospora fluostatini]